MSEILPAALQPYAPLVVGVVTASVILLGGWIAAKWAHSLALRAFRGRKIDEAVARFLAALAQYAMLAAAVVAAMGSVGVETTSLVAILGSAALAIGLALQGTLGHFASGVMLLIFRPFTIGDVITTAGHTGKVTEIGLFATTMLTPDNLRITVPNGAITGGTIVNITVMGTRRGEIDVGIAYGEDPTRAKDVILASVAKITGVLSDPGAAVALVAFGASSVDLKVHVWSNTADLFGVLHECRSAIYNALNAEKIEIPFNQIVVHQTA
jgi:small conductance mechanosensitive channel